MNALANSQLKELEKFLSPGAHKAPVTFARYTGQESEEERQRIMADPPDILLTNYVMLELILTRWIERLCWLPMISSEKKLLDALRYSCSVLTGQFGPTDTTSSQHRDDDGNLSLSALCKDFLSDRGCNVDILLQALVALQRITDRLLLRHGLASSPTGFKCRLV